MMTAAHHVKNFPLGAIYATHGVSQLIAENDQFMEEIAQSLRRHQRCDWGDLEIEDKRSNDLALIYHSRLLSAYHLSNGTRFWIITEADRSATTILLPEEY